MTKPTTVAVPSGPDILISEVKLNARETLRCQLGEYRGRRTIDIRKFYANPDGVMRPTPKGITLGISRVGMLADMASAARDRAIADGLIDAEQGGDE